MAKINLAKPGYMPNVAQLENADKAGKEK